MMKLALTPEQARIEERLRCEVSFPYFFENHGIAEVRELGLVPMRDTIWEFQRKEAQLFQDEKRIIVLKARQTGVSTMAMHFAYWLIAFGAPNSQHVLVLSKSKDDASRVLMPMLKLIHNNVDPSLRQDVKSDQASYFELANGNTVTVLAATEGGGRGHAATCVILDEYAFHRYPEANWNAVKPTLEGGGHLIIISTGNGMGNMFYDLWQKAKEGTNSFVPVFMSWRLVPSRDDAWLERERAESPLPEDEFKQEYPDNDREAFTTTGNCPFDSEWIGEQIKRAENIKFESLHQGRTRVWVKPEPGRSYVAGIDCAHGLGESGNPDRTSLKIFDTKGNHVASWDGKVDPSVALSEIIQLLHRYFSPFVVVERNGPGVGFIAALQTMGYKNFYRFQKRHVYPDAPPEKNPRIGVDMSSLTKPRMIHLLIGWVNSHAINSYDVSMWKEMLTFVQKGPTKWAASGSYKDDQVISAGWARWALAYLPRRRRRNRATKVRYTA